MHYGAMEPLTLKSCKLSGNKGHIMGGDGNSTFNDIIIDPNAKKSTTHY
jgi:hypothetical protein